MTFLRTVQSGLALVLAVASLATTGCSASWRDTREERDPLLRRARERRTAQDIPGSIELYQRALDKKPGLARAHLELGAIYDQNQRDYVRAIYHYQRYLELQPAAEKKELVQELIRHAHLSFAASLPDRPNEAVREIAMLKQEISALHQELERVRAGAPAPASSSESRRAAAPAAPAPAAAVAAAPAPATTPAPGGVITETYKVVAGDTLSRIAGKVYGDSKRWQEIYDANRAILPTPQSLKVGQTLQIPRKNNR
jgi:tetratricopeptide (TPR) repeat protein